MSDLGSRPPGALTPSLAALGPPIADGRDPAPGVAPAAAGRLPHAIGGLASDEPATQVAAVGCLRRRPADETARIARRARAVAALRR